MTIKVDVNPEKLAATISRLAPDGIWAGSSESCVRAAMATLQAQNAAIQGQMRTNETTGSELIEEEDFEGYEYMVQNINGVAVVSIKGELVPGEAFFNRYLGIVGYDELRNAVTAACNSSYVNAILLDIDSGGGASRGLFEAHDYLREIDANIKPIYTHCAGIMCSAAYMLGAVGREITTGSMSTVGSIGVIMVHKEFTKMLADYGITATVLRKGEFKALGTPYEKLDAKAKAEFTDKMDKLYSKFTEEMAADRGIPLDTLLAEAAEGKTFFGYEAIGVNLVDRIDILDNVLSNLGKSHSLASQYTGQGATSFSANTEEVETMARKRVVSEAVKAAAAASGVPESALTASTTDTPAEGVALAEEGTTVAATGTADTQVDMQADAATADISAEDATQGIEAADTTSAPAAEDNKTTEMVAFLQAELSTVRDEVVDLKVALKTAEGKAAELGASVNGLEAIARTAIQKSQIGLGGSATDQSHLHGEALVAEYNRQAAAIDARYPGAAQSEAAVDDTSDSGVNRKDEHRVRAVRFNKGEGK